MNIDEIKQEAKRCMQCRNAACTNGCPLNMNIPKFIKDICEDNFEEAYMEILENNYMGYICGSVCPYEKQCQGNCIKGIKETPVQIGKIEAGICEYGLGNYEGKLELSAMQNKKVAIIGGGPSGIACALELKKKGFQVTIYEKNEKLGGILIYGIPEYRLEKSMVTQLIEKILSFGIKVKTNFEFGKNFTLGDLFEEGYDAVYLAIGCEKSKMLSIPGADLHGVYGANEFLKAKVECENKKVIVIGGGNVAMDAARVSKMKGASEVTVVYRRKLEDMPANKNEVEDAMKEKISFIFQRNVKEVVGEKFVSKIICDDETAIDADIVIMAIGALPNDEILKGLTFSENGLLNVDEKFMTSVDNVFAGGDLIQNKSTVCMAIKNGKEAANAIYEKLL